MSCCIIGPMNITLKTKIRYKGQEYSSVDQLPPEVRAVYERAMAGGGNVVVNHGTGLRLVVNGKQYPSVADMSAAEKKLYDDAMQLIRDDVSAALTTSPAESSVSTASATTPKPAAVDSGWLTKRQVQLIILVAGVLLALALVIAAGR